MTPTPETESALDFGILDAKADEWMAEAGVKEMVDTITGVFARWTSPELLARFRAQVETIMRQSFAEGAVRAWSDVRPAPRKEGK